MALLDKAKAMALPNAEQTEGGIWPLVTVIVLSYNSERFMDACLSSVRKTSYPSLEIIVVENGSNDDSLEKLRRMNTEGARRFTIIPSDTNLGFAAGNNLGFRHASGMYVVFLNNDTTVDENWITELVSVMQTDSSIGACQSKLLAKTYPPRFDSAGDFMDHYGAIVCRGRGQLDSGQYEKTEEIFSGRGAALMVRRSIFQEAEPFDPDFFIQFEDVDLCWRLHLYGYKVVYVPKSMVFHAGATSNAPSRLFHTRKNPAQLFVKNYSLANLIRYVPVLESFRIMEIMKDMLVGNANFVTKLKALLWTPCNLRTLIRKRYRVQSKRVVSDTEALRLMLHTNARSYLRYLLELAHRENDKESLAEFQNWYFRQGRRLDST